MIVDAHCHIFPESFSARHQELSRRDATYAALFPNPNLRLATAETLVQAMDQAGVDRAVVMGMGWTTQELAVEANNYIAESVAQHPGRLIGFCSVNPAWGQGAVEEMDRCAAAGLRGAGELHSDSQGFDLIDERLMGPVMEKAREFCWPVTLHASEPVGHQYPGKGIATPDKLYRLIENFPSNVIVCAHWGGGLPFYALMPEVPEVLSNVYFDSAASPFLYQPEVFATVAGLVGAGKILLGTDYPLISHRRLLKQVRESALTQEQQAQVLGTNAARLLGL